MQAQPVAEIETRVMKKITWRLIPFLCLCYFSAFLDRVNVGFAREMMVADLGFTDSVYGLGAGIFFVGYFLFEVPSNLILERVGARLWIARIMVFWGILSACTMLVKTPTHLYILRFLLGAGEAGFFPGVILYLTYWFPSEYRGRAYALFVTAAVASGIVGSPLSGALLELDGVMGLRGWKWLFIIEGIPPIILGIVVLLRLPNRPENARWLTDEERNWLAGRLAQERSSAKPVHVPLWKSLTNPTVLLFCGIYVSNVVGGYGLDFFQPTLIKESFPDARPWLVGLLNAVPSCFAIVAMVLVGRSADRRAEHRWHFIIPGLCAALGVFLVSFDLPAILILLSMALSVSGRWSAIAPFWGMSTSRMSATTAAGAIAMINAVGNLGGLIGPFVMGRLKDMTGNYDAGLRTLAVMAGLGTLLTFAVRKTAPPPESAR